MVSSISSIGGNVGDDKVGDDKVISTAMEAGFVTPQNPVVPLTTRQRTKYLGISYLDTTISHPIHQDPFMPLYFRKIYKFIKTVHKSSNYNSLIYKILHVKSSFFLQKGFLKPQFDFFHTYGPG